MEHDFFDQRPDVDTQARKVGYIVVTGDKGLAGAYSHNVLKLAQQRVEEEKNLSLFLVGIVGPGLLPEPGHSLCRRL
ncbi:MAG: F0F1 ATP synthase subunit gamma [Oscillospiraceae bacterium]